MQFCTSIKIFFAEGFQRSSLKRLLKLSVKTRFGLVSNQGEAWLVISGEFNIFLLLLIIIQSE
jgi:hypothetical protein